MTEQTPKAIMALYDFYNTGLIVQGQPSPIYKHETRYTHSYRDDRCPRATFLHRAGD